MKMADWTPCKAPSDETLDQLIQLCEVVTCSEDDVESTLVIYVHRSGQYALSAYPIGGGWAWSMARIERRERLGYAKNREPEGGRRNTELNWTQFIETYGNGEAND